MDRGTTGRGPDRHRRMACGGGAVGEEAPLVRQAVGKEGGAGRSREALLRPQGSAAATIQEEQLCPHAGESAARAMLTPNNQNVFRQMRRAIPVPFPLVPNECTEAISNGAACATGFKNLAAHTSRGDLPPGRDGHSTPECLQGQGGWHHSQTEWQHKRAQWQHNRAECCESLSQCCIATAKVGGARALCCVATAEVCVARSSCCVARTQCCVAHTQCWVATGGFCVATPQCCVATPQCCVARVTCV